MAYGKYQNGIRYVESQREYREGIELDLDDIRYDLNRILLKVRELEGFLDSVRKHWRLRIMKKLRIVWTTVAASGSSAR
ncbi:MAG: hypothetical protein ACLUB0_13135 [Blautia hansenii]